MIKAITSSIRIFVVDDNAGDIALLEEFLSEKMENVEFSHAKSFKEAAGRLSLAKNEFDAVLLDLSLPDKTGMPLIKEILERCPATPVIVITAYKDLEFALKTLRLGVSDYLLKEELTPASLHKSILYSCERKKVSFDLETSEQKLNELFQLTPEPMWVIDLENLRFLKVNIAAINHYGYSADEFLLMTIKDIRPATETSGIVSVIEKCQDKGKPVFEGTFSHRKRNGEMMLVDVQSNVITYQGRAAAVISAVDVAARANCIKALALQIKGLREASFLQSSLIRNPIDQLLGLARTLLDAKDGNDKNEMLQDLLKLAVKLDSVVAKTSEKTEVTGNESHSQVNHDLKPVKCA